MAGIPLTAQANMDPSQLSRADKIAIFGATLRDVGGALGGQSGDAMGQLQQLLAQRQAVARQKAMQQQLMSLLTPQDPAAPSSPAGVPTTGSPPAPAVPQIGANPAPGGLSIRDPRLPALVMAAKNAGIDLGPVIQVLSAQKPSVHFAPDGTAYDEGDPSMVGRRAANPTVVGRRVIDENDPANLNKDLPAEVPFGWTRGVDGNLMPVPGGPADPAYQAKLTGTRRDQIVARPMPVRTKPASAGSSWLPSGAKVIYSPGG